MITTIRLTAQDLEDKAEIERSLQGAKLTHHVLYRRGIDSFKENILKGENEELIKNK